MAQIHRYIASQDTVPVNAYLVEGRDGVVIVDGTLTVSGGRGLRARLEAIAKPLAGVLVTHAHPDHYGGLVELVATDRVDICSVAGVADAIRRDDAAKEALLRPMFGDEWPHRRVFPNRIVSDHASVTLAGLTFTALDLGPGESPHDSVWLLGDDGSTVFSGDQAYNHMHGYLADGFHEEWLDHIALLRRTLPGDALLHPGHGQPAGTDMLAWQADYIRTFVDAVRRADWSEPRQARTSVIDEMTAFLPTDQLRFLMELSIEPVAVKLGLTTSTPE
jgi:glyoxylase-like metal-dependent hydrolase (beta-lactamase superfamily II)